MPPSELCSEGYIFIFGVDLLDGMKRRRHVLRAVAITATAAVAGCPLGGGGSRTDDSGETAGTISGSSDGQSGLSPDGSLSPSAVGGETGAGGETAGSSTPTAAPDTVPNTVSITFGTPSTPVGTSAEPAPPGKFAAQDGDTADQFGAAIAPAAGSGLALVGSPGDTSGNGPRAGSVYAFEQDGQWTQQATFAPADGDAADRFGSAASVSSDGSVALIGAVNDEDPNGELGGSAYLFHRDDDTWTEEAKVAPDSGQPGQRFGRDVALSADGTRALVSAPFTTSSDGPITGAVYEFHIEDGSWTQATMLQPDIVGAQDIFGASLSLVNSGDRLFVGALAADLSGDVRSGGVIVFDDVDEWSVNAQLSPDDGDPQEFVGSDVAASEAGDVAVVGARNDNDPNGTNAGSAYVFSTTEGAWTQSAKLSAGDGDSSDRFGSTVALSRDGTRALIGAPSDEDPNGDSAGSAYLFERSNGEWEQTRKLVAADGDSADTYGSAVALTDGGSTALVGAKNEQYPNGLQAGAVYSYDL
jgi:hypothetical protein